MEEQLPPRGKYPRNNQIDYAAVDAPVGSCDNIKLLDVELRWLEGYEALNNSMIMRCNNESNSDSLLFDRKVDFIIQQHPVNCPSPCFYYPYATFPPVKVCFFVPRSALVQPSFANTWTSVFMVYLKLLPLATMVLLFLRCVSYVYRNKTLSMGRATFSLLSTYFGHSLPIGLAISSPSSKLALYTWTIGILFVLNYFQNKITASRSIPAYSPTIKTLQELEALLDVGKISPCLSSFMAKHIFGTTSNMAYLEPLRRSIENCKRGCVTESPGTDCFARSKQGTHATITTCMDWLVPNWKKHGLMPGEESLLMFLAMTKAHGKFPLR
ncbi:hypothetical protein HPB48_007893 [Haemaphysalis longicornis]|uniref:Uncharacterized protein n=1 Tax=Haemaphysalis longicornis TaxID=44386 RepID=A0A9J6FXG4_HAELO|nr:hypothetical protein HPB48_007893 [Haemaphysalis longicornis]